MSNGKQFTLYNHDSGMNQWKLCFALEELGLTYDDVHMDFVNKQQKSNDYLELNPNGKIPTLVDHNNNDFAIWESNAILQYLVSEYDKEHKISVDDKEGKYKTEQWLFFQASGQGPYFGQAQWFMYYHPEKLPTAIKRYQEEIRRVLGVLDNVLSKQEWLVGDKCTIADLSFIKYTDYAVTKLLGPDFDFAAEYPNAYKWHTRMLERPAIKTVFKNKDERKRLVGEDVTAW
jgi:glutathione S-transferase